MNILHRLLFFCPKCTCWLFDVVLLHFSHFINTSACKNLSTDTTPDRTRTRSDLAKTSNQCLLHAQGDHFKCWLFILLETENGGGGWWAWRCLDYNPPPKQKLISLLFGNCLSVQSLSSLFFLEWCESKTAQLQYRLESCTLSDLITETLVPPPQRNTGISYQIIQMCPITES